MRTKNWAADVARYRQKDSERDKEIQSHCRTKEKRGKKKER